MQALNYACLTDELTSDSYARYADVPGLSTASMDKYWSWYLGERRPSNDPYAVPLKATDLAGLAPAHIHIAEYDPLADDGREYAQKLDEAGVICHKEAGSQGCTEISEESDETIR